VSVIVNLTERQLHLGILKLALSLTVTIALIAVGITYLFGSHQPVAVNFLLIALGLTFLANGMLAVLKIIDWLEARRGGPA
jgi:hypothetical protein